MLVKSQDLTLKRAKTDYFVKRFMDYIIATLLLFFLNPIFLVIAIAIKIDTPREAFFRQIRVGLSITFN